MNLSPNHESGLSDDDTRTLSVFVGKKLVAFAQAPNQGVGYNWADDEPLELTFEDGSILNVFASGFHSSGGLSISAKALDAQSSREMLTLWHRIRRGHWPFWAGGAWPGLRECVRCLHPDERLLAENVNQFVPREWKDL